MAEARDILVSFEGRWQDVAEPLREEGFEARRVLSILKVALGEGGDLERLRQVPGVTAAELNQEVRIPDPPG